MKKISILLVIIIGICCLSAMNNPKAMCVYIEMPNGSAPAAETLDFSVFVDGRQSETLTKNSAGCGYIQNESDGICYINVGSFDTAWEAGDYLVWTININGTPYGIISQQISDNTGESQYSYSADPYNLSSTPLPVTLSSFLAVFSEGLPVLIWVTLSEINNAGWNVYRAETEFYQESVQINPELIPGGGTTTETVSYSFTDEYEVKKGNAYWYFLESVDFGGNAESYGPIKLEIPPEEEGQSPEVPLVYGLHKNYPNPFNPDTKIEFIPETEGRIDINILNIKGQVVKRLFSANIESNKIGVIHNCIWDGTNFSGKQAGSGVYFCNYKSTTRNQIQKMVLIK
jgi:hypothetical protein